MADEVRISYGGATYRAGLVVNAGQTGTSSDQVQGAGASDATAVGNPLLAAGLVNSTTPASATTGQTKSLWVNINGALVTALPSTAAADGNSNTIRAFPSPVTSTGSPLWVAGSKFNGTTWDRDRKANASSRIASAAASVNATVAKASAGDVFRVMGNNVKASVVYLKIYNKATAPTVGTDVPVLTIPIAASGIFNVMLDGYYLSTGIAYGFTTDAADAGTTALLAGDILDFTMTYA
jgi:hypothetical protein